MITVAPPDTRRLHNPALAKALGRRPQLAQWAAPCQDCTRQIRVGEPVMWARGTAACTECHALGLVKAPDAGAWGQILAAFPGGRCAGCHKTFALGEKIMWASRTLCPFCASLRLLTKAGVAHQPRDARHQAVLALVLVNAMDAAEGVDLDDVQHRAALALGGEL